MILKKITMVAETTFSIVIGFKRRSPLAPASPTMHIQHRASLQKRSAMSIPRVITKRPRIIHSWSASDRDQTKGWREEGWTRKRKGWERRGSSVFVLPARDSHLAGRGSARAVSSRDFPLTSSAKAEFHAANIVVDNNEKARGLAGMGLGEDTRERCSPCEHARDTDGARERRESLNRQQTQTAASTSGVEVDQTSQWETTLYSFN